MREQRSQPAGMPPAVSAPPTVQEPPGGDPDTPGARTAGPGLDALADQIVELAGSPVDAWGVAALLESTGLRDLDARERYGREDIFALAGAVLELIRGREASAFSLALPPPGGDQPLVSRGGRARLWARGGFFFVPMAVQVTALIVVGYSQYASVSFNAEQASLVAMAVGASFLVTGLFVQLIGFLGNLFEEPGKHLITRRVVYAVLAGGTAAVGAFAAASYVAIRADGSYTAHQAQVMAVYFLLASGQALVNAALYMLRRYGAMAISAVITVVLVAVLRRGGGLSIVHSQWIALACWWLAQAAWAATVLHRRARNTRGPMRLARLPTVSVLARRAAPYGVYGSLYFALLISDRFVAWSAGHHPLPFWFNTPYELGLDAALAAAVPAFAYLEVTVVELARLMTHTAERYAISSVGHHNEEVGRFWRRRLLVTLGLFAVGGALILGLIETLDAAGALGSLRNRLHDPAAEWTFFGGLAGYTLVGLGLTSAVILLGTQRPWRVIAAMVPAVVVNVTVGLLVSRSQPFYTAVCGLIIGALVFACLTAWAARRTLAQADYWAYAAW